MGLLGQPNDQQLQVWPSFTDVALSVALIILFYLVAQVAVSAQTTAAMMEIRDRQAELRSAVENALPQSVKNDVSITEDGQIQRYSFADWLLFDSADAELKPSGITVLSAVGNVFKEYSGAFAKIQTEGHTDDRPIKQVRFPSNWELSSARATSVVRFLQDHVGLEPNLLSATGYSQYQPIDSDISGEARARNRRVEIILVYSVQDILDQAIAEPAVSKEAGK